MLRWIQENRKSSVGVFAVLLVALLMTSFGVSFGGPSQGRAAIKVNDSEISYQEFYDELRAWEDQYRRMLGENFERFAGSLKIGEQLSERMVSQALLREKALQWGFRVDDGEVHRILVGSGMFPNGYDREIYKAFLERRGLSSAQYEEQLRRDAVASQFVRMIDDLTVVSEAELKSTVSAEQTRYDFRLVSVDPASFITKVAEPEEQKVKELYEQNSADYMSEALVSYDYVSFQPNDFIDQVQIAPEDVELYYVDNQKKFSTQEEVKVRHVQISVDSEADGAKRDEAKKRAEEVRAKAVAGEPFDSLVKTYSEDYTTRDLGGDLGWLTRSSLQMGKTFTDAAFALKNGGISEVVISGVGYHVISVDSYKPSRVKELSEVSAEIEKTLREDQAPTYTVEKANEFLEKWQKSGVALREFAVQNSMTSAATNGLVKQGNDPEGLFNLTKKILTAPEQKGQIHDIGNTVVVISISEYKAPDVKPLSDVKAQIVEKWKKDQALVVAKESTNQVLQQLTDGKIADLSAAAAALSSKVEEKKGVKRFDSAEPVFNLPDVQREIFSEKAIGQKPRRVFEATGKFYLIETAAQILPTEEEIKTQIESSRESHEQRVRGEIVTALISKLKSEAEIEVSPDILVR